MSVSREEVRRVAALARLRLQEADLDRLAGELSAILDHTEVLERVEARATDTPQENPPGPDEEPPERLPPDPLRRTPGELAPAWKEGHFVVPRLSALDGEDGPGEGG